MENFTKCLVPSQGPRQHDVDLSHSADELHAIIDGEELQQDLQLTENQAYAATTNIPVVSDKCTTLSAQDPDKLYVEVDDGEMVKQGEYQLQDMILAVNQSYASTPNITVEPLYMYSAT
jgi:hypothetical protein